MRAVARPFRARVLASVLIAAGATAGSLIDTRRASAPVRAGAYHVIAADFHVHAFPGDGALPAWEVATEASRRGLHAVVISNHNQTFAGKVAEILPGRIFPVPLPLVIPSQEITTPRFHLVAAGITRTIDWRKSELEIANDVHAQGGVVIAAHPIGRYWRADEAMIGVIDGAEVAHPVTIPFKPGREELTAFFTAARAVNADIAPIGSSDFHMIAPLAICRTFVFAESVTVEGVLDAIRAGRTVAQDQDGVLYGDPALTLMLDQTGAATPHPQPRRLPAFFAAMVFLGLLGLVVVR